MTVHAIVPVFNRLALTQQIVECLRNQVVSEPLQILLINDGSTDGTSEWLASQSDIEVLEGDGSLFWGGAVDLALRHLDSRTAHKDWVLLINNDITVSENFVQRLLDIAKAYAPAAVGSVIRDENQPRRLLSLGPKIDAWRLLVTDLLTSRKPGQTMRLLLQMLCQVVEYSFLWIHC